MLYDRTKDIELCAETIKKNAEKIANQFENRVSIDIIIRIEPKSAPLIIVENKFISDDWLKGFDDE